LQKWSCEKTGGVYRFQNPIWRFDFPMENLMFSFFCEILLDLSLAHHVFFLNPFPHYKCYKISLSDQCICVFGPIKVSQTHNFDVLKKALLKNRRKTQIPTKNPTPVLQK
jgi:hypothetical protein